MSYVRLIKEQPSEPLHGAREIDWDDVRMSPCLLFRPAGDHKQSAEEEDDFHGRKV
jgi:hypothetical protein